MPIDPLKDPVFLSKLRTDPVYSPVLRQCRRIRRELKSIPPLPRSLRDSFYETGGRERFEVPFFKRRRALTANAILALLYPEKSYFDDMEALLSAILDEWSWAAPPHTAGMGEKGETFVDLFAAELGQCIAELSYLFEDRMDASLRLRAKEEVLRRVISSYEQTSFWWEKEGSNWTMVCTGNVAGAMLYLDPAAFERQKKRILESVNAFLSAFPKDGVCLEGMGYWHYGVGNFLVFADLYCQATGGEEDLLKDGRVQKILSYPFLCRMRGDAFPTVADAPENGPLRVGRGCFDFISSRVSVPPLPSRLLGLWQGNGDWNELVRSLLWTSLKKEKARPPKDVLFPDAGQAIFHQKRYSLFVKAGHNGEPHNHNDVGSFILATREGQILCDLGAGRYTAGYFDGKTRYDVLCCSSRGHSVPIIGGHYQQAGKEFCGTLSSDGLSVEFSSAYGLKTLKRLTRRFELLPNAVALTDEFVFESADGAESGRNEDGFTESENCRNGVENDVLNIDKMQNGVEKSNKEAVVERFVTLGKSVVEDETSKVVERFVTLGKPTVEEKTTNAVERFVTLKKPVVEGSTVTIGPVRIIPPDGCTLAISEELHALHGYAYDSPDGTKGSVPVYLLDFELKKDACVPDPMDENRTALDTKTVNEEPAKLLLARFLFQLL